MKHGALGANEELVLWTRLPFEWTNGLRIALDGVHFLQFSHVVQGDPAIDAAKYQHVIRLIQLELPHCRCILAWNCNDSGTCDVIDLHGIFRRRANDQLAVIVNFKCLDRSCEVQKVSNSVWQLLTSACHTKILVNARWLQLFKVPYLHFALEMLVLVESKSWLRVHLYVPVPAPRDKLIRAQEGLTTRNRLSVALHCAHSFQCQRVRLVLLAQRHAWAVSTIGCRAWLVIVGYTGIIGVLVIAVESLRPCSTIFITSSLPLPLP